MEKHEFNEAILTGLKNYYGEEAEIKINQVLKNNGQHKTGLHIIINDEDSRVTPVIYLDSYYSLFEEGKMTVDECIRAIVDMRSEHACTGIFNNVPEYLTDWSRVKDDIYPMLICTRTNTEILEKLISREFLDLSIIYTIRLKMEFEDGVGTVKITKELQESLGKTEEDIYQQAIKNLEKEKYTFTSMNEVIRQMIGSDEIPQETFSDTMDSGMYVLSNNSKMYGAAGILDTEFINKITNGNKFYLLPSSVHEWIFVRDDGTMDQNALTEMVREVNATQVSPDEVLSDHVYSYS